MTIKLSLQDQTEERTEIDLPDFIKYIFQNGTREQKRELISCLNGTIYTKNRQLYIKQ